MEKTETIKIYKFPNQPPEHIDRKVTEAPIRRGWMDENNHFYRCLPMTIANQNGWVVESPSDFAVTWLGGTHPSGVHFWVDPKFNTKRRWVECIFGHGVITFFVDFIVRTPPGVNLLVRGAPNFYVDGAHPLEGLVETDWLNFTFTMNWKLTSVNKVVNFKKGDPLCFMQPVPHNYSEKFDVRVDSLESEPDLLRRFIEYSDSRDKFRKNPNAPWQGHYFRGEDVLDGCPVGEDIHSIKLKISKPVSVVDTE